MQPFWVATAVVDVKQNDVIYFEKWCVGSARGNRPRSERRLSASEAVFLLGELLMSRFGFSAGTEAAIIESASTTSIEKLARSI
jgi:hypothetical protein